MKLTDKHNLKITESEKDAICQAVHCTGISCFDCPITTGDKFRFKYE